MFAFNFDARSPIVSSTVSDEPLNERQAPSGTPEPDSGTEEGSELIATRVRSLMDDFEASGLDVLRSEALEYVLDDGTSLYGVRGDLAENEIVAEQALAVDAGCDADASTGVLTAATEGSDLVPRVYEVLKPPHSVILYLSLLKLFWAMNCWLTRVGC